MDNFVQGVKFGGGFLVGLFIFWLALMLMLALVGSLTTVATRQA